MSVTFFIWFLNLIKAFEVLFQFLNQTWVYLLLCCIYLHIDYPYNLIIFNYFSSYNMIFMSQKNLKVSNNKDLKREWENHKNWESMVTTFFIYFLSSLKSMFIALTLPTVVITSFLFCLVLELLFLGEWLGMVWIGYLIRFYFSYYEYWWCFYCFGC